MGGLESHKALVESVLLLNCCWNFIKLMGCGLIGIFELFLKEDFDYCNAMQRLEQKIKYR